MTKQEKKYKEAKVINFMGFEILLREPKGYPLKGERRKKHFEMAKEQLVQTLCNIYGI